MIGKLSNCPGEIILLLRVCFLVFISLGGSVSQSWGDGIDEAILTDDLKKVQYFIDQGVELNPDPELADPPLSLAVEQSNVKIAELLIENGADVNAVLSYGPGSYEPIIFRAFERCDDKMVDLFLANGLRKSYFNEYLLRGPLLNGKNLEYVERLILQKELPIESSLPVLLRYAYGSDEIREIIRKFNPDIAAGKSNLLDAFIEKKGISIDNRRQDPPLRLPLATTFLHDVKLPFHYSPDKAFDGDLKTSWVEGVKGNGIGEKISFSFGNEKITEEDVAFISIFPGYGLEKYFKRNNRVKKAILSVYPLGAMSSQFTVEHGIGEKILELELSFTDSMSFQDFEVDIPAFGKDLFFYTVLFVLEIKDVYPGTDWDDTCVAEIRLYDSKSNSLEIKF